ncbi:SDR family oxidoreductase [Companilactobacillus sp.]|jgi:nucleoside-diphosphate-sugar epimerase|uniref:SDR family oxidoreductase n=1 Tax=Companilactobacillus sp. TaxID=2767905 RepID=UPI0025BE0D59|nr:aldehyde reductase [Companilactobacillus sp.]MCH4009764.1 aldehyde reductase [Companilactobacillus sp.]MCH4052560.1 aldehyde reductase [Companilactobacillus sp.]MCH4077706.1 aldehyde reductase [Companilactobacillus sp.]MCH4126282.1 aldehyde reductase [Companilactobacillus sp.]MCI1311990.1 aldehyde reductase [Companilactobacillus sp.]
MTETVLVTGGSGFLGLHIIDQLLNQNYQVKTTVRSLKKQDSILNTLRNNQTKNLDQLTFYEADLSSDQGWDEAMSGTDFVMSVASPVFFDQPKNEADAIRPAVEGIIRVLQAANRAQVKRVVMTSNFGAVGFSRKKSNRPTTEADWTDVDQKGISLYEKSKLIAEMKAWDYIDRPEVNLEFATVNPVAMLGPSLNGHVSGSFDILKGLFDGSQKRYVDLPLNIVDVRDVADIHIKAMQTPIANGQRFIASADGEISIGEMIQLIKKQRPELSDKIIDKKLPNWLINLAAIFNKQAQGGKLFIDMNRNVSNQKAKETLDWHPLANNEEIVLSSIDTMKKAEII